jgi:hypothetical protein
MRGAAARRHVRKLVTTALRDPASLLQHPPRELDLTIRALRRAQLLGRVAAQLEKGGRIDELPVQARDALVGARVIADSRARVGRWELNRLATALASLADIPVIALKGCAYLLAQLPNARGRVFADVDLLVPEKSLDHVASEIAANGWQALELTPYDENYYRVWSHELPPMKHVERDVEVDLHHNVAMRTSRLQPDARLLIADAVSIPGTRLSVLSPVDMALHVMTHLFYSTEMDDSLRELVDIDDLLRHFANTEPGFWERFWPRARQLHLTRPAYYGLRYAVSLLGTPVPESVVAASAAHAPPAPIRWLMDRLVPAALFPLHPSRGSRAVALARLALFLRLHWVRMPPLLLIRHIAHQLRARYLANFPSKNA